MSTKRFCLLAVLTLTCAAVAVAKTVYVTIDTQLRDKKGLGAKTVVGLKAGDELSLEDDTPPQYKVKTASGKVGYVHMSKVGDSKPEEIGSDLAAADVSVELNDERSSYAIRGLGPKAENYAKNKNISKASRDAVDHVQALREKLDTQLPAFVSGLESGE